MWFIYFFVLGCAAFIYLAGNALSIVPQVTYQTGGASVFDTTPAFSIHKTSWRLPVLNMWLMAVSASLIPAVLLISKRSRVKALTLWQRLQAWVLWIIKKEVCTRSTHAFVLCKSSHGKVDSVLETFDLYNGMYPSLCIGAQIGAELDEVVGRVQPSLALELGTHCGYSSLRLLRLLPPGGRLITVEKDPQTADHGEELILVAGYKHHQFEVLTSHSSEAIPSLSGRLDSLCEGFCLVLMDHDPGQYLTDLHSLETSGLLRARGCSIIFICRERGADKAVREFVRTRENRYCIKTETRRLIEVCYQSTANVGDISSSPLVS